MPLSISRVAKSSLLSITDNQIIKADIKEATMVKKRQTSGLKDIVNETLEAAGCITPWRCNVQILTDFLPFTKKGFANCLPPLTRCSVQDNGVRVLIRLLATVYKQDNSTEQFIETCHKCFSIFCCFFFLFAFCYSYSQHAVIK